jgi:hypothetical protein
MPRSGSKRYKRDSDDLGTSPGRGKYLSTLKEHWLLPDVCRGGKYLTGVMKDDANALERMAV